MEVARDRLVPLSGITASVLVTGREPLVSRIRLAWWRETL